MIESIIVRPEQPEDVECITSVTEQAFRNHPISRQTEHFIVRELRQAGALAVSMVAEVDGQVVGHIAFSPAVISDGSADWYTLGPISVTPEMQRKGVGSALMKAGLEELRRMKARGCVLAGDPAYYNRFGFGSHPELVMEGVPPEYFLSLAFDGHSATGKVTAHPAFGAQE